MKIIIPFCVTQTKRPLTLYCYAYLPRLIICILIAFYVYFTPTMLNSIYFYPILIILFLINEALIYLMLVSRVGFYARISDPSIGGTYITLLSTLGNLGASVTMSAVFYAAEWIESPEIDYPLLVGICFGLGVIWLVFQYKTIRELEILPKEEWYLSSGNLDTGTINDDEARQKCVQGEDQLNL